MKKIGLKLAIAIAFIASLVHASAAANWDWESDSGVYSLLNNDKEACIWGVYERTYCEYCDWWDFGCDCDPAVNDQWTLVNTEAGHKTYETVTKTFSVCYTGKTEAEARAIIAELGGANVSLTGQTEVSICFTYTKQVTEVKDCTHD